MERSREFPYDAAFDRNLGLIADWEQLALRAKRVAIAGMGGVGGVHLLTLARLGIGAFTIADLDQFEFANFNRQAGAMTGTIGRDKAAVLEEMARDINPELHIRRFDNGVTVDTIDDFLAGADLYVDGLDFFVLELRRLVFARCAALGIPAITAAPIGMGTAYIVFDPKGMSFEQYFRLEGQSETQQRVRFLLGFTPHVMHNAYLVDPARVDLARKRGPSTVAACQLCAGVMAVAALKILLRRGNVRPAPYNHQFDPYPGRFFSTRLRFGNGGPLQRLKIAVAAKLYAKLAARPGLPESPDVARSTIEEILNLARWAPSGDNTQPWRFRVVDGETVGIQITHDPANLYEYRAGEPTWLAAGGLIETLRIAASGWGRAMTLIPGADPATITARLIPDPHIVPDPLLSFLTSRSVDRRAYRSRGLTAVEKDALSTSLGQRIGLTWHEGIRRHWSIARLSAAATRIRLRCPETFAIHQRVIDWTNAQSTMGIPARAVGLSRPTLTLMRWAMRTQGRFNRLNAVDRSLTAAIQMDYLPGLRSGAYFVLTRQPGETTGPAELIDIGRAIQRFWLTATRLGLVMQPVLAVVAFAHFGAHKVAFTADPALPAQTEALANAVIATLGVSPDEIVFIGRIGEPFARLPSHRSSRRPLADLMD